MRKQIVLASLVLVFAVSAAGHRAVPRLGYDLDALVPTEDVTSAQRPATAYPPCRSRSDDRCQQVSRSARARVRAHGVEQPRLAYAQVLGRELVFTSRTRPTRSPDEEPASSRPDTRDRSEPIGL